MNTDAQRMENGIPMTLCKQCGEYWAPWDQSKHIIGCYSLWITMPSDEPNAAYEVWGRDRLPEPKVK